jgi:hypothetical protein
MLKPFQYADVKGKDAARATIAVEKRIVKDVY